MTPVHEASLLDFERRLTDEWLPVYCTDPARNYDIKGFRGGIRSLSACDAADFIYSIDTALARDVGVGGIELLVAWLPKCFFGKVRATAKIDPNVDFSSRHRPRCR